MIRRTMMWLAVGFGVGTFLSMWFGPDLLAWYAQPPGGGIGGNICTNQITWATHTLVKLQLGLGIGLGVVLSLIVSLARRKPASAPPN